VLVLAAAHEIDHGTSPSIPQIAALQRGFKIERQDTSYYEWDAEKFGLENGLEGRPVMASLLGDICVQEGSPLWDTLNFGENQALVYMRGSGMFP
jgi:hypothetical protein